MIRVKNKLGLQRCATSNNIECRTCHAMFDVDQSLKNGVSKEDVQEYMKEFFLQHQSCHEDVHDVLVINPQER